MYGRYGMMKQRSGIFLLMDVVGILTNSSNPRKYWSVLKTRLKKEGSELTTNCNQLKMQAADGKYYKTDVGDTEQIFRLIQSIPSPKAEPLSYGWPRLPMIGLMKCRIRN